MGVIHAIIRNIDSFRNSHELSINDDDIAFAEFCAELKDCVTKRLPR